MKCDFPATYIYSGDNCGEDGGDVGVDDGDDGLMVARPNLLCQLVKCDFPATYVVVFIVMMDVVITVVAMMMIMSVMTRNIGDDTDKKLYMIPFAPHD